MTEVPLLLKQNNWAIYAHAILNDPLEFTDKLVSSLITTMKFIGEHQYDELLTQSNVVIGEAFRIYDEEKNEIRARFLAMSVLSRVGFLAYDIRYSSPEKDGAFKFDKETFKAVSR